MASPATARRRVPPPTVSRVNDFCDVIASGGTIAEACVAADISQHAWRTWKSRAATARSGQYSEFWRRYQEALTRWQRYHLDLIEKSASQPTPVSRKQVRRDPDGTVTTDQVTIRPADWRASAWLLERRFPNEFGGKGGGGVNPAHVPDDELPTDEGLVVEFVHVYPDQDARPAAIDVTGEESVQRGLPAGDDE